MSQLDSYAARPPASMEVLANSLSGADGFDPPYPPQSVPVCHPPGPGGNHLQTAPEQPWTAHEEPWAAPEEPWTASEEPWTASEEPWTASEEPWTLPPQYQSPAHPLQHERISSPVTGSLVTPATLDVNLEIHYVGESEIGVTIPFPSRGRPDVVGGDSPTPRIDGLITCSQPGWAGGMDEPEEWINPPPADHAAAPLEVMGGPYVFDEEIDGFSEIKEEEIGHYEGENSTVEEVSVTSTPSEIDQPLTSPGTPQWGPGRNDERRVRFSDPVLGDTEYQEVNHGVESLEDAAPRQQATVTSSQAHLSPLVPPGPTMTPSVPATPPSPGAASVASDLTNDSWDSDSFSDGSTCPSMPCMGDVMTRFGLSPGPPAREDTDSPADGWNLVRNDTQPAPRDACGQVVSREGAPAKYVCPGARRNGSPITNFGQTARSDASGAGASSPPGESPDSSWRRRTLQESRWCQKAKRSGPGAEAANWREVGTSEVVTVSRTTTLAFENIGHNRHYMSPTPQAKAEEVRKLTLPSVLNVTPISHPSETVLVEDLGSEMDECEVSHDDIQELPGRYLTFTPSSPPPPNADGGGFCLIKQAPPDESDDEVVRLQAHDSTLGTELATGDQTSPSLGCGETVDPGAQTTDEPPVSRVEGNTSEILERSPESPNRTFRSGRGDISSLPPNVKFRIGESLANRRSNLGGEMKWGLPLMLKYPGSFSLEYSSTGYAKAGAMPSSPEEVTLISAEGNYRNGVRLKSIPREGDWESQGAGVMAQPLEHSTLEGFASVSCSKMDCSALRKDLHLCIPPALVVMEEQVERGRVKGKLSVEGMERTGTDPKGQPCAGALRLEPGSALRSL